MLKSKKFYNLINLRRYSFLGEEEVCCFFFIFRKADTAKASHSKRKKSFP